MKMFRIIPLLITALSLTSCERTGESSFDIGKYEYYREKVKYAEKMLPSLSSVGNPIYQEFAYRQVIYSFVLSFVSHGMSLFLDYDETNYEIEKENVLNNYSFLDSPKRDNRGSWQFPVASFDYQGYSFKITPNYPYWDNSEEYCCKSFTMIGFDEKNYSIAYLYYCDIDIDYLEDGFSSEEKRNKRMPEIIDSAFYWRQSSNN